MKLRAELVWVVVGQLLGFVGSFIGIKVLTTVMGPKGYGELALGLTIAGLFNMFIYGPLANVIARFFPIYRERQELGVFFAVLKKMHFYLAGSLAVIAGVAGLVLWILIGREWALIGFTAILYGIVAGVNASYISLQSAIRQRQVVALHQGVDVWLRTVLSIFFLLVAGANGYSALLGYVLGTCLITVSQTYFARKNNEISCFWNQLSVGKERYGASWHEFANYASSFVVFSLFAAISMYSDRWVIQGLYGSKEVGIYAAISQIAIAPTNLLFASINQFMVPIIFERAGSMSTVKQRQESNYLVRQTIMFSASVSLILFVLIFSYNSEVVGIVTSPAFTQYSSILWIVFASSSFFNIGQALSLKGLYYNKPNIYFVPKLMQAITFLVFAYLFGMKFGFVGIAWGGCTSSIIYLLFVAIWNRQLLTVKQIA